MNAITFQLRLLQPLLLARVGAGEENSAISYSYIPGSVLRGAIIQQYLAAYPDEDISHSQPGRKFFFSSKTCYLNAYPAGPDQTRMLPRPLSWRTPKETIKGEPKIIWDFVNASPSAVDQPKMPSGDFAAIRAGAAILSTPRRYIQVHNSSEERMTKKSGLSNVFRYDTLAEGQTFCGVILAENEVILDEIQKLLQGKLFKLGGSRSAEYGLVEVVEIEIHKNWCETEGENGAGDQTVILLSSDTILRDKYGQFSPDLSPLIEAKPIKVFTRLGLTGGFNRKWGLPIQQAYTIQAGSVFVYRTSSLKDVELARLKSGPIGDRVNEGFGRVVLNWNNQSTLILGQDEPGEMINLDHQIERVTSPEGKTLLEGFLNRDLVRFLEEKLTALIVSDEMLITGEVNNAQLSRIRQIALVEDRDGSYRHLQNHLNNLKGAKRQFERSYIGNRELFDWLDKGIKNNSIWETYLKPAANEIPQIAGVSVDITTEIKVEFTLRLLDSLFRKASRQRKEG